MAEGRREVEAYMTKKNGSGSNVGGSGGDMGPPLSRQKFSSQFLTIIGAQTGLRCRVPATMTYVFDMASGHFESAASRLAVLDGEKKKTADLALNY